MPRDPVEAAAVQAVRRAETAELEDSHLAEEAAVQAMPVEAEMAESAALVVS